MNDKSAKAGLLKRLRIAELLLVVCSAVITVVMVDCIAFFILDIKVPGYRPERFFQFSPVLGWFHRPNTEGYWYRYGDGTKYKVRINSFGFADSERSVEKTRPRVALLGNSTTEFWEAEEKDRGQYRIEELLNKEYEVLNLGVRAYGTDQTFLLFRNIGVYFAPDIVIYNFCINDIHDNVTTRSKPYFTVAKDSGGESRLVLEGYPVKFDPSMDNIGPSSSLRNISLIYRTIERPVRKLRHLLRLTGKTAAGNRRGPVALQDHFELRPFKRLYDAEDDRRMGITTGILALLNDYVKRQGMKFLVVEGIYRPALDSAMRSEIIKTYGDRFDFDKVSVTLEKFLQGKGIPSLSLQKLVSDRKLDVNTLMHPLDPMHLNKKGIEFYSRAVVDKLASLHWTE